MYLCYGKGKLEKKWAPVMSIFHRKLQVGLHRFTGEKKIKKHWSQLFKLFETDPDLKDFLTDKGEAEAPIEYLVTVEQGLRSFGKDKFAFGTFAMDSETEWHDSSLNWRKRECFISMARYVLGLGGYAKYIHFRWSDFVSRSVMTKTFNNRHVQYSSGESRLTELSNPAEWDSPLNRRKRKRSQDQDTPSSSSTGESPAASTSAAAVTWDSEEGEWVED